MKLTEARNMIEQKSTTQLLKGRTVPIWSGGENDKWEKNIDNWTKNVRYQGMTFIMS